MNEKLEFMRKQQLIAEEVFEIFHNNQLSLIEIEDVLSRVESLIKNRAHA